MLVKSNVNESNVIKWKTNSLNINENMNEYLLVMDVSWMIVGWYCICCFYFICYVGIYSYYVAICCILILLSICMILMLFVKWLVGADRVCFAFGARFCAILAVYAR